VFQPVLEIDKCFRRPEPLPQFLPRHHVARTFHEQLEDLERLPPQFQSDSVFEELSRTDSNFVRAEPVLAS